MMKKMMKKIAVVLAAATMTITAGAALASAKENTAEAIEMSQAEMDQMDQDDAISAVFDRALDSGLFTQEEIDDNIASITVLMKKFNNSKSEEKKMEYSDKIAAILDQMEDVMAQAQNA